MKNGDKNITYNIGSKNTLKEYIYLFNVNAGKTLYIFWFSIYFNEIIYNKIIINKFVV